MDTNGRRSSKSVLTIDNPAGSNFEATDVGTVPSLGPTNIDYVDQLVKGVAREAKVRYQYLTEDISLQNLSSQRSKPACTLLQRTIGCLAPPLLRSSTAGVFGGRLRWFDVESFIECSDKGVGGEIARDQLAIRAD